MEGTKIDYILESGGEDRERINLDEFKGEIFDSVEKLKSTLVARAANQITKMVDAAVEKANAWFPSKTSQLQDDDTTLFGGSPPDSSPVEISTAEVMLPDGRVVNAKVKVHESLKS